MPRGPTRTTLSAGQERGGEAELSLAQSVTVLVTTSPMRADPELEILRTVFESLALAGV